MAIPGLTGYFSKDIIIESAFGRYDLSWFFIYWLAVSSATLSLLYSIRILILTFFNVPNHTKLTYLLIS